MDTAYESVFVVIYERFYLQGQTGYWNNYFPKFRKNICCVQMMIGTKYAVPAKLMFLNGICINEKPLADHTSVVMSMAMPRLSAVTSVMCFSAYIIVPVVAMAADTMADIKANLLAVMMMRQDNHRQHDDVG